MLGGEASILSLSSGVVALPKFPRTISGLTGDCVLSGVTSSEGGYRMLPRQRDSQRHQLSHHEDSMLIQTLFAALIRSMFGISQNNAISPSLLMFPAIGRSRRIQRSWPSRVASRGEA